MNKTFLFLLSLFFLSCNSLKIANVNAGNVSKRKIEKLNLIGENEKINHNGDYIGEIILKENNVHLIDGDIDWIEMKEKISKLAKSYGGNILEISKIGYDIEGYAFYLSGKLYFKNDFTYSNENDKCTFVLFRDGLEGGISSAFKIRVSLDQKDLGLLKGRIPMSKEPNSCFETIVLECNRDQFEINMDGQSKYFKVETKEEDQEENLLGVVTSSEISIGHVNIDEIQYPELGRLMWIQNQE